jgi:hypothetical protein
MTPFFFFFFFFFFFIIRVIIGEKKNVCTYNWLGHIVLRTRSKSHYVHVFISTITNSRLECGVTAYFSCALKTSVLQQLRFIQKSLSCSVRSLYLSVKINYPTPLFDKIVTIRERMGYCGKK